MLRSFCSHRVQRSQSEPALKHQLLVLLCFVLPVSNSQTHTAAAAQREEQKPELSESAACISKA